VPATQRLLKFARLTALLSAAWTILCALLLLGWQTMVWLRDDAWQSYTLATVIRNLHRTEDLTYVTASADRARTEGVGDWLLDTPASAFLLIVAAMLLAFYLWLARAEKWLR
jgi:hypothetical protein